MTFFFIKDRISKDAADMLKNLSSDTECIRKNCEALRETFLRRMKLLLYEVRNLVFISLQLI